MVTKKQTKNDIKTQSKQSTNKNDKNTKKQNPEPKKQNSEPKNLSESTNKNKKIQKKQEKITKKPTQKNYLQESSNEEEPQTYEQPHQWPGLGQTYNEGQEKKSGQQNPNTA